ncbi:helix-turn-helix domain-containing protein [Terriglobus sp. RCC_193]|uniref:helix-turn-helix domain-containing protein n=1 Tax=Terriglobus sp. RCC_193 TaxID=3239218 RepID=UPI0035231722
MEVPNAEPSTICVRVGNRIRELRQAKGWSQQLLADHAQIERSHLARLELGEREAGLFMLEKIANALSVKVGALIP